MPEFTLDQLLEQAVEHHLSGHLQKAEPLYRAILEAQPDHAEANHHLGLLLAATGQAAEALPWLKAALESNLAQPHYWLSYATGLYQAGRPEAAQALLTLGQKNGLSASDVEALSRQLERSPSPEAHRDARPAEHETQRVPLVGSHAPPCPEEERDSERLRQDAQGSQCEEAHETVQQAFYTTSKQRQRLIELFRIGNFVELEAGARQLTEQYPADGFAWKVLGSALLKLEQGEAALAALRRAVFLTPRDAELQNAMGGILKARGHSDDALEAYRQALALKPDYAEAHFNFGVLLQDLGRSTEAEASYRRSLSLNPESFETHCKLTLALKHQGRLSEAEASCRQALSLAPDNIESLNNLGNLLTELGRQPEAMDVLRHLLEVAPEFAEAHNNLGNVLQYLGRHDKAEQSYRRALTLNHNLTEAHSNLGRALQDLGHLNDAETSLRRALALDPNHAKAHYNLGMVLEDLARRTEAEASYRRALAIQPNDPKVYSNLLFTLAYTGYADPASLRREAEGWEHAILSQAERDTAHHRRFALPHLEERPLRVGLLSAELGQHAVAHFLLPWLRALDRTRITLIMYPTKARREPKVAALRALADAWTPLVGLSDSEAAERIRADAIDILIDTSGHTADNRLGVVAHRAAPVQCHYIGYFASTGLTEMDWFLADETLIPPELDAHFTEQVWRLPRPWLAYDPLEDAPQPAWQPDPDGTLWLGSFNNLNKVREDSLRLWAKVLHALPEARLLLKDAKAEDLATQTRIRAGLSEAGIDPQRVVFAGRSPAWHEHMTHYDRVDIALDTLPMNSGTTAFDALWMGVPLVTLAGDWMGGRMGAAILTAIGRTDWIARNAEDYVATVVTLARDLETRRALRATQRERMRQSPLCDGEGLARALEDAFEQMFDQASEQQAKGRLTGPRVKAISAEGKAAKANSHGRMEVILSKHDHETLIRLWETGALSELEIAARRATEQSPADGFAWKMYGGVLMRIGRADEALVALEQAVSLNDTDADTHKLYGCLLSSLDKNDQALAEFDKAIALMPSQAGVFHNRANVNSALGRWSAAESDYRHAIALNPEYDPAHIGLGALLGKTGRLAEAERSLRSALAINPKSIDAHNLLGQVLTNLKFLSEAESCYQNALSLDPENLMTLCNLGGLYRDWGKLEESERILRRALAIKEDYHFAHNHLGLTLQHLGRLREAEDSYRRALSIEPDNPNIHSNFLFTLAYTGLREPTALRHETEGWEQAVLSSTEREAARHRAFAPPPPTGRPLRLGLLSAELGKHAVAVFLCSWLRALDRRRFSVWMYPTKARPESEAAPLRALADAWIPLIGLSDQDAAARIRDDQIDILIETSGHTAANRLGVMARRAAPVQCHYVGYFGTTGLSAIDWFLADATLVPPSLDAHFTEGVWRLPRPWLAYDIPQDAPEPAWQPAPDGTLWLGSFNSLTKVREQSLQMWAKVLQALPEAKLLLKQAKATDAATQTRIRTTLAATGIAEHRLVFAEPTPSWPEHMAQYDRLDIALETFPLNSGTTAFDALWMGVPLVTLACDWMGGRMGAAILTGLNRPEWIAQDAEDYVAKVVALARDVDRRRALRFEQREQMRQSPLCDGAGLARALEDAFEQMFAQWWEQQSTASVRGMDVEHEPIDEARLPNPSRKQPQPMTRQTASLQPTEPLPAAPSPPTLEQTLLRALAYHQAGNLQDAEPLYREILETHPQHPESNHFLGVLLLQAERPLEALPWLRHALEADASQEAFWLAYVDALHRSGQNAAAREILALGRQHGLKEEDVEACSQMLDSSPTAASSPIERDAHGRSPIVGSTTPPDAVAMPRTAMVSAKHPNKTKGKKRDRRNKAQSTECNTRAKLLDLLTNGHLTELEAAAQQAIERAPTDSFAWKLYASALTRLGRPEEALQAIDQAIRHNPRDPDNDNIRGGILMTLERTDEAVRVFARALEIDPKHVRALYNQASAYHRLGQAAQAEQRYREAIRWNPRYAQAHNNLGNLLLEHGRLQEAERSFRQAIECHPELTEAHVNLGNVLEDMGRLHEAVASYQDALALDPKRATAYCNLGVALRNLSRLAESEQCYRQALALRPNYADALSNLGWTLSSLGRLQEAEDSYRRALAIEPGNQRIYSSLLFTLAYTGLREPAVLRREAQCWERAVLSADERDTARHQTFRIPSQTGRPLRVGLLSAELGNHPVARFLLPWLRALDRRRVSVRMYPTKARSESEAAPLRALADAWTPIVGLSDQDAAARIRADRIDILIDTSGHTADNRLGVIARRAAPVQCHYIGYFGTTGLTEMDWFLADDTLVPQALDDGFTEQVWRLPRPWLAYDIPEDAPTPAWQPAPDGTLWLGSFNNLNKVREQSLLLWAKVLHALPQARLLLKDAKATDPATQKRIHACLAEAGIAEHRLVFAGKNRSWTEHMAQYDRLDIALDTLPLNSGTTAFDALWMGVPLVTLTGDWMGGRMGAAILAGIGRTDWIARDAEEYVATVVALARDVETRRALRATQRERMRHSPLCDGAGLARTLEATFEHMIAQVKGYSGSRT